MLASLNWLNTHLDLSSDSPQQLDDLLTFAGIEVEGIETKGLTTNLVVVAQIKDAVQHPDADKLKVCQVDAGEGSLRQIVCGAKNYSVGDKVPCALPGADLGGGFVIKDGKLRGVESRGMLCGASEIGQIDQEDGLMILPADAKIGQPLTELFPGDTILEIEITPNRPDLLSHYGTARELAALSNRTVETPSPSALTTTETTEVSLTSETCPYYTATHISGVTVGPSPTWLAERLESIGLRPINNVVDITNYVLHELGHPLHAFDAAKVTGPLHIRQATAGESFTALDEVTYTLDPSDTVISDASGAALALAGVMGGLDSGVTESTTDIILESAYFTTSEIRRTSRRLILSSDSSYRFERGTDPNNVLTAAALATDLIKDIAAGTVGGPTEIAGQLPILTQPVSLDHSRLQQLMGDNITLAAAEDILASLGLEKSGPTDWIIPSYRQDLTRHIDLVEEIARVHGLENIVSKFSGTFVEPTDSDRSYDTQLDLKKSLAAQGFYEAQTIKLISETQLADSLPIRPLMDGDLIRVALPLSEDHTILRPSLTAGLVAVAARNIAQQATSLRFFELGRQFRNMGGGKAKDIETDSLAILMGGKSTPANWSGPSKDIDLFDLKATIATLVPQATIQFAPRERDGFLLASDILVNGQSIGAFAQLSPARCRAIDANFPIYLAELDMKKLEKVIKPAFKASDLPQFPGSSRDVSIEAPANLPIADIEKALSKLQNELLVHNECTDLFADPTGEKLSTDKKAVTWTFHYRSQAGTLKSKQVDQAHATVLAHLSSKLPITFR